MIKSSFDLKLIFVTVEARTVQDLLSISIGAGDMMLLTRVRCFLVVGCHLLKPQID